MAHIRQIRLSSEDIYYQGLEALQRGNPSLGVEYLETSAKQDYAPAIDRLAYHYHRGDIVKQDFERSYTLTQSAVRHRHPIAMYRLAQWYIQGASSPAGHPLLDHNHTKALYLLLELCNNSVTEQAAKETVSNLFKLTEKQLSTFKTITSLFPQTFLTLIDDTIKPLQINGSLHAYCLILARYLDYFTPKPKKKYQLILGADTVINKFPKRVCQEMITPLEAADENEASPLGHGDKNRLTDLIISCLKNISQLYKKDGLVSKNEAQATQYLSLIEELKGGAKKLEEESQQEKEESKEDKTTLTQKRNYEKIVLLLDDFIKSTLHYTFYLNQSVIEDIKKAYLYCAYAKEQLKQPELAMRDYNKLITICKQESDAKQDVAILDPYYRDAHSKRVELYQSERKKTSSRHTKELMLTLNRNNPTSRDALSKQVELYQCESKKPPTKEKQILMLAMKAKEKFDAQLKEYISWRGKRDSHIIQSYRHTFRSFQQGTVGNFEEALDCCHIAIDKDKDNLIARIQRVTCFLNLNDFENINMKADLAFIQSWVLDWASKTMLPVQMTIWLMAAECLEINKLAWKEHTLLNASKAEEIEKKPEKKSEEKKVLKKSRRMLLQEKEAKQKAKEKEKEKAKVPASESKQQSTLQVRYGEITLDLPSSSTFSAPGVWKEIQSNFHPRHLRLPQDENQNAYRLYLEGKYKKAIKICENYCGDYSAIHLQALCYIKLGDDVKALHYFNRLPKKEDGLPKNIKHRLQLGIFYFRVHNYEKAFYIFSSIEDYPENKFVKHQAKYWLARCYLLEGKFREATRMLEQNPLKQAKNLLPILYMKQKLPDKAYASLDQASPLTHISVLILNREWTEAENRLSRIKEKNFNALFSLAKLLSDMGEVDKALRIFYSLPPSDQMDYKGNKIPQDMFVKLRIARLQAGKGEIEVAISIYQSFPIDKTGFPKNPIVRQEFEAFINAYKNHPSMRGTAFVLRKYRQDAYPNAELDYDDLSKEEEKECAPPSKVQQHEKKEEKIEAKDQLSFEMKNNLTPPENKAILPQSIVPPIIKNNIRLPSQWEPLFLFQEAVKEHKHIIKIVGGVPRDILVGRPWNEIVDFDFAVDCSIGQLQKELAAWQIQPSEYMPTLGKVHCHNNMIFQVKQCEKLASPQEDILKRDFNLNTAWIEITKKDGELWGTITDFTGAVTKGIAEKKITSVVENVADIESRFMADSILPFRLINLMCHLKDYKLSASLADVMNMPRVIDQMKQTAAGKINAWLHKLLSNDPALKLKLLIHYRILQTLFEISDDLIKQHSIWLCKKIEKMMSRKYGLLMTYVMLATLKTADAARSVQLFTANLVGQEISRNAFFKEQCKSYFNVNILIESVIQDLKSDPSSVSVVSPERVRIIPPERIPAALSAAPVPAAAAARAPITNAGGLFSSSAQASHHAIAHTIQQKQFALATL